MTTQRSEFPATAISLAEDRSSDCGREVTTILICDNPLLRSGFQHVLSGTPFTLVEDNPATDPKLVSGKAQGPALIILAMSQPSNCTPEIVRQAKERYPAARLVLLADHVDLSLVTQGREAGVDGFCLSGSSREVLITTLEMIMLGESMLPGTVVRSMLDSIALSPEEPTSEFPDEPKASDPGARGLSAREGEILRSLMEGAPNKVIARKLHVAEATVKVHVKAILRKIGASNRTQAAMWAKGHLHG